VFCGLGNAPTKSERHDDSKFTGMALSLCAEQNAEIVADHQRVPANRDKK